MRDELSSIEPIPTLPVYLKLAGRKTLLAGGSLAAVWKLELLAATGASVRVCAPSPCPEMHKLVSVLGDAVQMLSRPWETADLDGCAIAVGALDGDEALQFRDAARAAGVPVNVIDRPEFCDFQFGTIIARPPLLIGISTDGAAPVLGQALRTRIEALLPRSVQAWAEAAKSWRADLQGRDLDFRSRRRFWETFARLALDGSERLPGEADRALCLAAAASAETHAAGRVALVGVGPGDPDLLTLQAVRALQSAEILVHEVGIGPATLHLARREARREAESQRPEATAEQIRDHLREGRSIAWVGLGDPSSRTGLRWTERRSSLMGLRIPFDLVRGLSDES